MQISCPRIIVVQTVQHWSGDNGTCCERIILLRAVGQALFDTLMGAKAVVVSYVLTDDALQLRALPDEHMVEIFPFQTTDQAFTDGIGSRCVLFGYFGTSRCSRTS